MEVFSFPLLSAASQSSPVRAPQVLSASPALEPVPGSVLGLVPELVPELVPGRILPPRHFPHQRKALPAAVFPRISPDYPPNPSDICLKEHAEALIQSLYPHIFQGQTSV